MEQLQSDIEKGVELIWNNQFDEAEKIFEPKKSTHARYALHFAEVYGIRSIISESELDRQEAIKRYSDATRMIEQQLTFYEQANSESSSLSETERLNRINSIRITLGDCYTSLAEMRARGAFNLRKGWKHFEKALQFEEGTLDNVMVSNLKFGAGMFFFVISLIPSGLAQKAASIFGFKSDKDRGLQYLRECFESNTVRSVCAAMLLSVYHVVLTPPIQGSKASKARQEEASKMLAWGTEKYKKGSLFQLVASLCFLETGQIDTARDLLQEGISNCKHVAEYPQMLYQTLSNCYIFEFQWEKAIEVLRSVLNHIEEKGLKTNPWSVPWIKLKLGALNYIAGQQMTAAVLWQEVIEFKGSGKCKKTLFLLNNNEGPQMLSKVAKKFLRTGGALSIIDVLLYTFQLEKILVSGLQMHFIEWKGSTEKISKLLALIEEIASNTEGALQRIYPDSLKKPQNKGFLGYISFGYYGQPTEENEAILDNRLSYIIAKSCVLRSLNRLEEAFILLEEALNCREFIYDKLVLVILLVECGRCNIVAGNNDKACEFFKEALRPTSYGWEEIIRNRIRSYLSQLNVNHTELHDTEEIQGELEEELSKEEQSEL